MVNISFDTNKRDKTLQERGLDFGDAGKIFAGLTRTLPDTRKDYGEDRYITMGHIGTVCVVLVWTPRDGTRRIISMRRADEKEERNWSGAVDES